MDESILLKRLVFLFEKNNEMENLLFLPLRRKADKIGTEHFSQSKTWLNISWCKRIVHISNHVYVSSYNYYLKLRLAYLHMHLMIYPKSFALKTILPSPLSQCAACFNLFL